LGERRRIHAFFLTDQNEFQREQVRAVEEAARVCGHEVRVRYAESNALIQIQQLYESVYAKKEPAPDAIVVEPVAEEGMPRVARNAAAAGISWAVINADTSYVPRLRQEHSELAFFGVAVDNVQAGEIQGAQILKLLGGRKGASVLLVQGTLNSSVSSDRLRGMERVLEAHPVSIATVDTDWTRSGARAAVSEWLKLGRATPDLVVGQNDEVAQGARDALEERLGQELRRIPFIGCDGLSEGGQRLVKSAELAATVVTPLPGERAIRALSSFYEGNGRLDVQLLTTPVSLPPLEALGPNTP
jgi:ABC-type sugar transport system substrate-binding protein